MSAIFGESLTFGQASGPEVVLRVFGDEHYARYEDPSGYSVIYDEELGLFCYVQLSAGGFRSTGISISQPPPEELARHLQEPQETIAAKAKARKLERAAITGGHRPERVVRTFGPNQGLLDGRQLSIGAIKGLTILVNFQDLTSSVTRADVDDMLNGANYTRNGNISSAHEYFARMSSGKLNYTNVVVGPYTLSRNREFYINNLLVEEALQLAVADGLDLRQFDSHNEDIVDALNIMYAGQTQYRGELWPHNWHIDLHFGQVRTDLYLLTSLGRTAADLSIGTFCHENGHLLCRFPDMYDYGERDGDSISSAGIGSYCLMGSGNHNDNGRSPSPVCAYLRDLAGWCDNEIDISAPRAVEARHGDYNTVIKYRTSKANEYFLVENRARTAFDRGLPASGLAVYHCDIFGSNELQQGTASKHYQCALIQADGRRDLELNNNRGDGDDLFGAIQGTALSSESFPDSREWDGRESGLLVSDVSPPGEIITFTAGETEPAVQIASGTASPNKKIPDLNHAGISSVISIAQSGTVGAIKVSIDIEHTYIGDLRVSLTSPAGRTTVLHPQLGGSADDLIITYDSATPGVLSGMIGQPMMGNWLLNVSDRAARDVGKLRKWSVDLIPAPAQSMLSAASSGARSSASPEAASADDLRERLKTLRDEAATLGARVRDIVSVVEAPESPAEHLPRATENSVPGETARAAESALSLTNGQRRICEQIINVFETGTVEGKYGAISIYRDGPGDVRQITYGRSQTTEYGNLRELVEMYVGADGNYAHALRPYLDRIGHSPLVDDETFKDLLRNAGNNDPVMRATQDRFFDKRYFQPALRWARDNGFTSALSMLVIYDSYIHSGSILQFLRERFPERPPAQGGDGCTWIQQYVDVRHEWLTNHRRPAVRASNYRTRDLAREIDLGNWDLSIQPIMANGTPVRDAPFEAMAGERNMSPEMSDATLAGAATFVTGMIEGYEDWSELEPPTELTVRWAAKQDAPSLARRILDDPNIELATRHPSGVNDNATARQNIIDTADGRAASRSTYGNAPGGTVHLDTDMLAGLLALAETYSFHVSELCGASHSPNSRHYRGVVADVNYINGKHVEAGHPQQAAFRTRALNLGATQVLGPGDKAHSKHIHIGWPL